MENWFDVVEPHRDIKEGEFDASVFAADLGDVANDDAPTEYNDPYIFFKRTYLTDGLENLLREVRRRLVEGTGDSVLEIQTPFGGGKTHSLVALYHFIRNGEKVAPLLPDDLGPVDADMAVVVGTELNPLEGREIDGLEIRTLWGEIAYQLGGKEGYKEFEENDRKRVAPGKQKLKAFLKGHEPCLLLLDEVLEYVNRAANVALEDDETLRSMTFAFLQELTQTVSSLDNCAVVGTLPASSLEDYGEKGEESLRRLEKIFGRMEAIRTPVKGEEVYSIIRRRLFADEADEAKREEVISDYFQLYQDHQDELPSKVRSQDFKDKLELAYPFHPDVVDILYERWGTYPSFQRTRGVLQLLANAIEHLYDEEKNIDLILPSDISLDDEGVRRGLIKHIGEEYETIIGSDIAGSNAKAQSLDEQNRNWKHLAEGISTTVFLYSFTADESEEGARMPYIKLATLRPGVLSPLVTEVLQKLGRELWYLNEKGETYYFSKIPNLNRMVLDKKDLFEEQYRDELKTVVRDELGDALRTYLWPNSSDDISDNKEPKFVVLDPDLDVDIEEWIDKKGDNFREYKNTLIFAVPDTSRLTNLVDDVKEVLALREIRKEIQSGEGSASEDQLPEVEERIEELEGDFSFNVRRLYHTAQIGDDQLDFGQPTAGRESLSHWYLRELTDAEKVAATVHQRFLINKFLQEHDWIRTGDLLDQFYKDTELPMIESSETVEDAILQGVEASDLGLAYLDEEEVDVDSLRFDERLEAGAVAWSDDEVLLSGDLAREVHQEVEEPAAPGVEGEEPSLETEEGQEAEEAEPEGEEERYTHLVLDIEGLSAGKIADINRGILLPLTREVGDVEFSIRIEVEDEEGVRVSVVEEQIQETVDQLGASLTQESDRDD